MKRVILLMFVVVLLSGCIQEIHKGKFSIDIKYCDDICGRITEIYYDGDDVICEDENKTSWICSDYVDWFEDKET